MITQMTKYVFLMLSEGKEEFLKKLQELGVVDITRSVKPVDEQSASMLSRASAAKEALKILDKCDYSKDPDYDKIKSAAATKEACTSAEDLISYVNTQNERLKELSDKINASRREIAEIQPWGEFEKADLERLGEAGYVMNWYNVDKKAFDPKWKESYPLQIIEDNGKKVWFVVVTSRGELCDLPAKPSKAPEVSYKKVEADIEVFHEEMIDAKASLLKANEADRATLETIRKAALVDLDRYLADASSDSAAENMVSVMTGFAPKDNEAELCAAFDHMDLYYMKEDAVEEDNPPIKWKNNKFTQMFEVLTDMYGMPVYSEFDPTSILGPFFLLFFAMCMGDAGYGILLLLIGFFLKKKMSGSMQKMAPLVMTLGVGTFFVGIILGTFFGVPLVDCSWVPQWLKNLMIVGQLPGTNYDKAMALAIGVGVFHICLAMTMKAICYTKRFGFKKTISTWAWLILIVGGIIIAGLAFLGIMDSEVTKWAVIILAVISGLGIYILNDLHRNPLINIGSGLWDTYNMVTGLLGDVLSYIRLYALGLAGGMLGGVFNTLAGDILAGIPVPGLNWLCFGLILVFGHVLNLAMSCLGAFVHPLRLSFVEYFKNSGYEGKGKRYNPMRLEKEE